MATTTLVKKRPGRPKKNRTETDIPISGEVTIGDNWMDKVAA